MARADDDEELSDGETQETQAGRGLFSRCRARCGRYGRCSWFSCTWDVVPKGQVANSEELFDLMKSTDWSKIPKLKQEVMIGDRLWEKDTFITRVGHGPRAIGSRRGKNAELMRLAIQDCIDSEQSVWIGLKKKTPGMPWCMILRCPCLVFWMVTLVVLAISVLGVTSHGLTLNTDFDTFMESDGDASLKWTSFISILTARDESEERRRLSELPVEEDLGLVLEDGSPGRGRQLSEEDGNGIRLYKPYLMHLTHISKEQQNLLKSTDLAVIKDVEARLKALSSYQLLCKDAEPKLSIHCRSGVSFINYVFPAQRRDGENWQMDFDGTGTKSIPLQIAVEKADLDGVTYATWPKDAYGKPVEAASSQECKDVVDGCARWDQHCAVDDENYAYMQDFCRRTCGICDKAPGSDDEIVQATGDNTTTDTDTDTAPAEVTALRTRFMIQAFCCWSGEPASVKQTKVEQMDDKWKQTVVDVVTLFQKIHAEQEEDGNIMTYYQGDYFDSYETEQAVANDSRYALMSYCFVLVYATIHTRSVFLSFVGLFLVMLSLPGAVGVFLLASASGEITLLMCLSIFIVIGVGSDMLFVYTDFYKQSIEHTQDPIGRLKFTYEQAASATAATTFTTAMSFFANIASVLRPLREFGFFMGVSVILAWLLVLLAYPAVLVLGERFHLWLRRKLDRTAGGPRVSSSRSVLMTKKSLRALSTALDPTKRGAGEAQGVMLGRLGLLISRVKIIIFILFFILCVVQGYVAIAAMQQATGVPQLFPDSHNQQAQKEYDPLFQNYNPSEHEDSTFRATDTKCGNMFRSCSLYGCQSWGKMRGNLTHCECSYDATELPSNCASYNVQTRLVGREGLAFGHIREEDYVSQLGQLADVLNGDFINSSVVLESQPLENRLVEILHWDTGVNSTASMVALQDATVSTDDIGIACPASQLCYCGVPACMSTSFKAATTGHLRVHAAVQALDGRRLETSGNRQLQESSPATEQWTVPPSLRADVTVVFGIVPATDSRLLGKARGDSFSFDKTFQLEDPRAQLAAVSLCDNWPSELKVTSSACWLQGFRDWWIEEQGEVFPVRSNKNFHSQALWYAQNRRTNRMDTMAYVFFSDEEKLTGMYFTALIDLSRNAGSDVGLAAMELWDQAIAVFNADEKAAAIKGAWHTSRLWQASEAEKVILDSTLVTLCISLGCVFLGVLFFTRSVHLAMIVMVLVMTIIIGLLFFMVKIMGWKIGVIEVVSLIVFVGLSVDYCLHLAHKYHSCHITDVEEEGEDGEEEEEIPRGAMGRLRRSISAVQPARSTRVTVTISETPLRAQDSKRKANIKILDKNRSTERFERAKYALERIGGSIVGSALTTMGSACFLLPCVMHVFFKLGAVVCGVTFYAVVFALIPLPAILMCIGPCGHDFKSLLVLLGRQANNLFPEDDDDDDEEEEDTISSIAPAIEGADMATAQRRYVLNMPGKGMAQCSDKDAQAPTRTRVAISG
mmetsp:Transcript_18194/g.31952  ORF Transcript_18194/g.31952 Transcript_18194/m.31952 type:complete len:1478 (+) Transcript_18194:76-4509(+)|eukprot:CAMPEP_0197639736 /NCGR_PEP_ID=MMETSP1338-20131121/14268_1 /TAXON_ID=43686 ORGANISM="Pelagodinium beii, Strain RCC1491" /NCGR_SAMPLE_ID=MMETSP1338 /ASSEMBLY_ACC=CAM_ASM_000754 /LENGTH=1477 /DNA_ID=CAMNT_0043212505 /DNA_START=8 /DNA_END=4441 /DNA_ORIENTATION=+